MTRNNDAEVQAAVQRGGLLTSIHLRWLNACDTQVRKFRKEWPDGMKMLKKNLIRAAELGLDVQWFVSELRHRKMITVERNDMTLLNRAINRLDDPPKGQIRARWREYRKVGAEVLWRAIR